MSSPTSSGIQKENSPIINKCLFSLCFLDSRFCGNDRTGPWVLWISSLTYLQNRFTLGLSSDFKGFFMKLSAAKLVSWNLPIKGIVLRALIICGSLPRYS
jgi:hypothetical protein